MNREPILIYIVTNDVDVGAVESFLTDNKYFGYVGVVCFSNTVGPNIDSKGKITVLPDG